MFYKIKDEINIEKAPRPLRFDGKDVFTTSEEIHNKQGYYRLQKNECPQDNKNYRSVYQLEGNVIVQKWLEIAEEELLEEVL